MNTHTKGTRMERLCLDEFKAFAVKNWNVKILTEWRVTHSKFNNNDFLGCWDLALLVEEFDEKRLCLIQVKSDYRKKVYDELLECKPGGAYGYYAIYGSTQHEMAKYRTPNFDLIPILPRSSP